MTIVITMGGLGSRFKKAGYKLPKYQIPVCGKTLFAWSMLSLESFKLYHFIFLVRKEDNAKDFIKKECLNNGIRNYDIIEIAHLTRGQAETAMLASNYWGKDESLLIYNIDTYVEKNQMTPKACFGDGFIPCFHANGDHWSFVKLGANERAIEVREKERISDNCTIGAYYFKTARLYEKVYNKIYAQDEYLEKGEQYIAPMYNIMIKEGLDVFIQNIPSEKVHVLGTPEEVMSFEQLMKK